MAQDYSKKLESYQKHKDQRAQFFLKKEIDSIKKEGSSFSRPSLIKYAFLFVIALIVDIVDLLVVSGVGYAVSLVVSIIGSSIIMFTLWMTDAEQGKAKEYIEGLQKKVDRIQKNIGRTSKMAMKSGKFLRKFKSTKKAGSAILKTMAKTRRAMKASPIGRMAIASLANLLPIIGAINLMVVWVYFSYRGEKKAFEEAEKSGEEASMALRDQMLESQNNEVPA